MPTPMTALAFRVSILPEGMALARVKTPGFLWVLFKPFIENLVLALVDLVLARLTPAGSTGMLPLDFAGYKVDSAVTGVMLLHPSGFAGGDEDKDKV